MASELPKISNDEFERKARIDFLYQAINDAQATIRMIDTKAAILMAMIAGILTLLVNKAAEFMFSGWFVPVTIVLLISLLLSCYHGFRILFPQSNPAEKIQAAPPQIQTLYFVPSAKRKWYHRVIGVRLSLAFDKYQESLNAPEFSMRATDILAFELLKVSWIREIKLARMKLFTVLAFVTLALGILIVVGAGAAANLEKQEPQPNSEIQSCP